MPRQFTDADKAVPFPDNVPTTTLTRLSLSKLVSGDKAESDRLFEACQTTGFFVLDLRDHESGAEILKTVDPIFDLSEDLFKLDFAEKDTYSFQPGKPIFGYKGYGVGKIDSKGTPDRCEFWSINKDDMLGQGPELPNPAVIKERREDVKQFIYGCHGLVELVSSHLDNHLSLPKGTFATLQDLSEQAGNQVRLIKTPPQAVEDQRTSLVPHTDIGAITVLFNILGGLQILPPGGKVENDEDWKFVKPSPGCAIINLGDSMVQWTNGALRSNMHRVAYAPGAQGHCMRYSVAYFSRPRGNVLMTPLQQSPVVAGLAGEPDDGSSSMTACEWELQKGTALRSGLNKPQSSGGKLVAAKT